MSILSICLPGKADVNILPLETLSLTTRHSVGTLLWSGLRGAVPWSSEWVDAKYTIFTR